MSEVCRRTRKTSQVSSMNYTGMCSAKYRLCESVSVTKRMRSFLIFCLSYRNYPLFEDARYQEAILSTYQHSNMTIIISGVTLSCGNHTTFPQTTRSGNRLTSTLRSWRVYLHPARMVALRREPFNELQCQLLVELRKMIPALIPGCLELCSHSQDINEAVDIPRSSLM